MPSQNSLAATSGFTGIFTEHLQTPEFLEQVQLYNHHLIFGWHKDNLKKLFLSTTTHLNILITPCGLARYISYNNRLQMDPQKIKHES